MNYAEYKENKEISLVNLLVYCLLQWKFLVIGLVVGAIMTGGFQTYKYISGNKEEEVAKSEEKLKAYEDQIEAIEKQMEAKRTSINETQAYLNDSLLMKLDPYNEAVCVIDLSVTLLNDEDFQQTVEYYTTPVSYMTSKIQAMYMTTLNAANLSALESWVPEKDVENRYLKELVSLERMDGGILELQVFGRNEEEVNKGAEIIWAFLLENKEIVANASYDHELTLLAKESKVFVNNSLENTKLNKFAYIDGNLKDIEELQEKLDGLSAPKQSITSIIKAILLGIAGGFIMGMGFNAILFLLGGGIFVADDAETITQTRVWSTLGGEKMSSYQKMLRSLCGERIWEKDEESFAYIASLVPSEKKKIVLTSTLSAPAISSKMEMLGDYLRSKGFDVVTAADVLRSEEAVKALRENEISILMEKSIFTKRKELRAVRKLLESEDKKISGLVIDLE